MLCPQAGRGWRALIQGSGCVQFLRDEGCREVAAALHRVTQFESVENGARTLVALHRRVSSCMSRFSVAWAMGDGCACACVTNVTNVTNDEERMQEWFSCPPRTLLLLACVDAEDARAQLLEVLRFSTELGPRRKSRRAHQHYTPSTYFPLVSGFRSRSDPFPVSLLSGPHRQGPRLHRVCRRADPVQRRQVRPS